MTCDEYRASHARYTGLPLAREVWESDAYHAWLDHGRACGACELWGLEQTLVAAGIVVSSYPCAHMARYATITCPQHPDPFDCPDALVVYSARYDEYALPVRDGGSSRVTIAHCPWCGAALASKRERWFAELARLGFDDPLSQEIPEAYQTDAWWRRG